MRPSYTFWPAHQSVDFTACYTKVTPCCHGTSTSSICPSRRRCSTNKSPHAVAKNQQIAVAKFGVFHRLLNGHRLHRDSLAAGENMRLDQGGANRERVHGDGCPYFRAGQLAVFGQPLGLRAALRMRYRRSRQHLVQLGQALALKLAIAIAQRLVFRMLDGNAQRRLNRIGFARSLNSLHPCLDGQLCDLQMSLRAKGDAGARRFAQDSADPFQTFFSLRTDGLGNANLPCGELHFHGQPPLFPLRASEASGETRIV